mmetsp:Transcript_17481/g.24112  ORF Transcript_17481/g.24112 Transcript_17481/m.24112 type:complete len:92 (+) Transcript_17481:194-469(+)
MHSTASGYSSPSAQTDESNHIHADTSQSSIIPKSLRRTLHVEALSLIGALNVPPLFLAVRIVILARYSKWVAWVVALTAEAFIDIFKSSIF